MWMTSGAQVLFPPRASTSAPALPPGTADMSDPERRHAQPSSEMRMGRPLPVPYVK